MRDVRDRDLLYVVAKAPRPGHAKTRLCPPLLPQQAAHLAEAFLRDTIDLARRSGADLRLICQNTQERHALLPYAPPDVTVHLQDGAGVGAAMQSAFVQGQRDAYRAVAVLGTDTPALSPQTVARAFSLLRADADVVLGPSADGGYYLLAAREAYPTIFKDMVWSTSTVAQETLARCDALGLRTRLLDLLSDVDDVVSLLTLRSHLAAAPPEVAPHTRAVLRTLAAALPAGG